MKRVFIVGSLNCDLVINAPYAPRAGETLMGSGFMTNGGGKGAKPVKGGKPSTKGGKSVDNSRSEKKTAKPVRKEGWAKPKAKKQGKK